MWLTKKLISWASRVKAEFFLLLAFTFIVLSGVPSRIVYMISGTSLLFLIGVAQTFRK